MKALSITLTAVAVRVLAGVKRRFLVRFPNRSSYKSSSGLLMKALSVSLRAVVIRVLVASKEGS